LRQPEAVHVAKSSTSCGPVAQDGLIFRPFRRTSALRSLRHPRTQPKLGRQSLEVPA
jgi:hypothetical protein